MLTFSSHLQDPVIEQINHSVQRLTHSTSFLQFLGQHALIVAEDMQSGSDLGDDKDYHFLSLLLNLVNTFVYMVNTYIIVPTADDYSVSLGAAATVCGVIIGSMAVAQIFSSVYFSAWSNKSYFRPLVFSSIMLFLGNLLYALAYDLNSLTVLIVGRLLCGYSYYYLLVLLGRNQKLLFDQIGNHLQFGFGQSREPPLHQRLCTPENQDAGICWVCQC
jgi:hypothetical protein